MGIYGLKGNTCTSLLPLFLERRATYWFESEISETSKSPLNTFNPHNRGFRILN